MLLSLILMVSAFADTPIALSELPTAVTATITARWPDATMVSAARDGGELEVVLKQGDRRFEAILRPDGRLEEVEERVDPATLPEAVQAAAKAQGTLLRAERLTAADGATSFEVVVQTASRKVELHLDERGAPVRSEAADDEEDGDED